MNRGGMTELAADHTPDVRFQASLEIRVASTPEEYEAAFRIAYSVYSSMGFLEYSPFGLRVAPAQLKPSTVVLLAFHRGQAIASLSLYEDDADGIPSESAWPTEVERLRAEGRRFFELGSLMALPGYKHLGKRLCLELFRAAWLYIRGVKKADGICAFVLPKHEWFYKRLMKFNSFGPSQSYRWNGLCVPEIVPLFMDLTNAEEDFRVRYDRWGQSPRNLYRFFVVEGGESLRLLRLELRRRDFLDFAALTERFERYLPATTKEKSSRD